MRTTPCSRSSTSSANGVPLCIASPRPKCASWYRLAPVETIQSMNPASMSGTIVDIPRPAGVMAPVRLMPTVTSSASIRSANNRQPSASRPALYARNASSTSSGIVSRPVMGRGSMGRPRNNSLRVVMPSGVPRDVRELLRALLPGLPDDRNRLARVVGDMEQIQVRRGDLPLPRHPIPQPVGQAAPVRSAEQDHRKVSDLPGLDQGQGLEQFVHRPVAAGEDDEGGRVFHEHRLAHEEIAEVDRPLDVWVDPLLERQLDVAADGEPDPPLAATVRGFNDPRPTAG